MKENRKAAGEGLGEPLDHHASLTLSEERETKLGGGVLIWQIPRESSSQAGHQESPVSLMCSITGWEQPVEGVVSARMQGWISSQSSGGPWPATLPGVGGLQGAFSWLLHVRKECFKTRSRVKKMGSAGMWTGDGFQDGQGRPH